MKKRLGLIIAGAGAGLVAGLFGAGGGLVLVPLLGWLTRLKSQEVSPSPCPLFCQCVW